MNWILGDKQIHSIQKILQEVPNEWWSLSNTITAERVVKAIKAAIEKNGTLEIMYR
ncbi:MAG: hypothetical protein WCX48_07670 [Bacteroidales bacterium]